jgi:hypothetical protein
MDVMVTKIYTSYIELHLKIFARHTLKVNPGSATGTASRYSTSVNPLLLASTCAFITCTHIISQPVGHASTGPPLRLVICSGATAKQRSPVVVAYRSVVGAGLDPAGPTGHRAMDAVLDDEVYRLDARLVVVPEGCDVDEECVLGCRSHSKSRAAPDEQGPDVQGSLSLRRDLISIEETQNNGTSE